MIFSLKQLLLVALASLSVAQHVQSPEETDVESTSWCKTNSDGFGGKPITSDNYKENKYYYELTISGTDTEAAISDLEIRIANYLLAETSLFDVCARRLKSVTPRSFRKLQQGGAVAITTRPDDFLYEDVACSSSGTVLDGETCVVVEGAYRVYFEEGSTTSTAIMVQMNQAVKKGMDSGFYVEGDIRNVEWTNSPAPNSAGAVNNGETDTVRSANKAGETSTPIIVGASVGGLAAIGLIAFYRRRSLKGNDEDTFTTPPGFSTSS